MENFPDLRDAVGIVIENYKLRLLASLACVFLAVIFWRSRTKYKLPPGPVGFPVVGYLPFLGPEPYKDLNKLCKRYGNVFGLYMGRSYVVVLGDYTAVKDAFSKNTTTDRPPEIFAVIPDGVGFSSVNGEEWTEQRKYCMKTMRDFGLGKKNWESIVQAEVDDFVDLVAKHDGCPFDASRLITASIANNMSAFVFGSRLPMTEDNVDFLYDSFAVVFQSLRQAGFRNFFPWLYDFFVRWELFGYEKVSGSLMDFNNYIRNQCKTVKEENVASFVNGYFKEIRLNKEHKLNNTFHETNLYGNVQAIFLGGSETTRTSLSWLFLIMASQQQVQVNVQVEVGAVLGREGKVRWSDRADLPYTFAVIMEGQRYRTIAPLNTSRMAMEDIKIGGYDVPKGTTIIANNWGLHNDTQYWADPEEFQPERFLGDDGKQVNFKHDSYVPFSYGKRMCPGETIAMIEILYYFVAIMQKFHIYPLEGESPNLNGNLGLTYQAVPQKLRFEPRT